MHLNLTTEQLSKYKRWGQFFPDKKVKLNMLPYHYSWEPLMQKLFSDPRCANIETKLSTELEEDIDVIIYPPPELVFNALILTPFEKVTAVFLGQDPYFSAGQAMGLCFSVPYGTDTPSSLTNVYENQLKFKTIKKRPKHGNLDFWALQGCLMLNSSLTVKDGAENKNCHQNQWRWFTNAIISYVSANKINVVFALWGADAYDKMCLIDLDNHEVTASSHPSGLSCHKPMKNEPAFAHCDHFNKINTYLEKSGKEPFVWQL